MASIEIRNNRKNDNKLVHSSRKSVIKAYIFKLTCNVRKAHEKKSYIHTYRVVLFHIFFCNYNSVPPAQLTAHCRIQISKQNPECVSFIFWEKLRLDNFVSRLTDLYTMTLCTSNPMFTTQCMNSPSIFLGVPTIANLLAFTDATKQICFWFQSSLCSVVN